MLQVIKAPSCEPALYGRSLFLAGGIRDCPDWQSELIQLLEGLDITVYNPRREEWAKDPEEVRRQVAWEYDRLRLAKYISFWFCEETHCPISLFELGSAMERTNRLFIGMHPNYRHRQTLEMQTQLKDFQCVYSIGLLSRDIYQAFKRA